ncbi:MAG TPA: PilT/PilU family type 4a pilus ATPase [Candidatus Polarisedimenticolia bacterium]|nr:PilT/PilU family type 4a pilus ATPase [Candidatus Polarisedimenticolia bacterium]
MPFDLDALLEEATSRGASDLLLVPGARPTIRIHGDLTPVDPEAARVDTQDAADMLNPFLTPPDSQTYRSGSSVDFCFERNGIGRFRCNLHRMQGGSAASIRLLPEIIPDFSQLNLPAQVARFAEMHKGFVLVVGPTGAGKSTTIACLLDIINARRAVHIVTIEDPIEYRHRHKRGVVEQIEIGGDAPSFADALRHALRQDPDVIHVGEMRDLDTIATALTAAETGHLVFSTLHTNDTSQAIDRIIDVFPAHQQNQIRQQMSLSLSGVVAQHLVPALDGKSRLPAVEILLASDAVRNLIRTSKTHQLYSTLSTTRSQGMQTLEESLASLVKRRLIARDDAMLRSNHADELESLLK